MGEGVVYPFLLFLDFSATFNTFKRGSFLDGLEGFGVDSTVLCWFSSFGTSSSQCVGMGGEEVPHLIPDLQSASGFGAFSTSSTVEQ